MRTSTVPHIVLPSEVRHHLQSAAIGQSAACLTASYQRVAGSFSVPDTTGRLLFYGRDDAQARQLDIGQSVRVDYRYHRTNLAFFSRICELASPGEWVLDRPRTVQRLSRRIEPRALIGDKSGVTVAMVTTTGFSSYPLVDLSSGGLAVRYDARDVGLWVGRRITVWLEINEQQPVPLSADVRHVSRRGCPPGHKLAGLRFVNPNEDARRMIKHTLTET
jgi:hypothetical protein